MLRNLNRREVFSVFIAPVLLLVIVMAVAILAQKAFSSFVTNSDLIAPAVTRYDDIERGVACWITGEGGISCLKMPLD